MIVQSDLNELMPKTLIIARQAGALLMKHYNAHAANEAYLEIEIKSDQSPVTVADKESSDLIVTALKELTPHITVISEENKDQPAPKNGLYWTVDPLDGTKGVISRNDHFYVKIALVEDGKPILGVIHEPVYDRFYHSVRNGAAFCVTPEQGQKTIKTQPVVNPENLRTVFNSLHYNTESYEAARQTLSERNIDIPPLEQAKGMCKTAFYMEVATGGADIFVNCATKPDLINGNGHSWDYAPDELIIKNAGGVMIDLSTGRLPRFDDPYKKMNAMIGLADKELGKRSFPELKKDCV